MTPMATVAVLTNGNTDARPDRPLVVAVASDGPAPGGAGPAWIDLNSPDAVLQWLSEWLVTRAKVSAEQADNRG